MKFAAVINVGPGPEALAQALKTQSLLLEHMGTQLHSIRLALPHLFKLACREAIADEPDILVVAGGPRSARRAGQIVYEKGMPIVFLPGPRSPDWTRRLWSSLTLEELVQATARGDFKPMRLGTGFAGQHIFFDNASCGLLPQIAQLRDAFHEAETFSDDWNALSRAVSLTRLTVQPAVRLRYVGAGQSSIEKASTLVVTAQGFDGGELRSPSLTRLQTFSCVILKYASALSYLGAVKRAMTGGNWRKSAAAERFDCAQLNIDAAAGTWLILDGDPIKFQGPVDFRFLPKAVQTFRFTNRQTNPKDEGSLPSDRYRTVVPTGKPDEPWNLEDAFLVGSYEVRRNTRKNQGS